MGELAELLDRVKAATGPSDELDCRILSTLLSMDPIIAVRKSPINGAWCAYDRGYNGQERLWHTPSPFRQMPGPTASIDAALALVDRVLPDWQRIVGEHSAPGDRGTLWKGTILSPGGSALESGWAPTPALALLAALLSALIAQGDVGSVSLSERTK